MIDRLLDGLECRLDIGKINDPARGTVYGPADMHFNSEAVAMEATAFVPLRDVRQLMSSLDCEFLENFHGYLLGNPQCFMGL